MEKTDQLRKAFDIVALPNIPGVCDWRDPINWVASESAMDALTSSIGITLDDIVEAIQFYTATIPVVTRIGGMISIKADGYRRGPAGDN